jgi:trimethylamine:corrinoid methyltransferase-like protein
MEYSQWQEWDKKEVKERAKHLLNVKLSSYKKPYIEKSIAKQLIGYVHGRKNDQ